MTKMFGHALRIGELTRLDSPVPNGMSCAMDIDEHGAVVAWGTLADELRTTRGPSPDMPERFGGDLRALRYLPPVACAFRAPLALQVKQVQVSSGHLEPANATLDQADAVHSSGRVRMRPHPHRNNNWSAGGKVREPRRAGARGRVHDNWDTPTSTSKCTVPGAHDVTRPNVPL
jgi:hypothetical protein